MELPDSLSADTAVSALMVYDCSQHTGYSHHRTVPLEYWFALTCIVVIALISKLHLKTVPAVPVTVMVTMLVTMGVFLLAVRPISASNAEKLVKQAGYTDLYRFKIEFSGTFWTTLPDDTGIGCTMPEEKDPLGYYGFRAYRDSEKYCVVVSAARGQIEVQEKQGE